MELPKIRTSRGDVLSGIRSKLGFKDDSAKQDDYAFDDYAEDGEFADDYGEYGYSDEYADDYGEYGYSDDGYGSDSGYGHGRASSRSDMSPRLVSIEDVRAHTQVPDRLKRDPLPARHVTASENAQSLRGGRVLIDNTAPSPGSPESRAARSAGLNSLFEPTEGSSSTAGAQSDFAATAAAAASLSSASASAGTFDASAATAQVPSSASVGASFDPFDAYQGSRVGAHAPQRATTVIRPVAYGDVERVAKIVRAGDVAILSLVSTPSDLAKRVLDFSFGVACCADARVDCIADKVFAIMRGDALSESEAANLRSQGVI